MDTVTALRFFKTNIEQAIERKTGWGKNDLVDMINKEYQIVLERLITMEKSDAEPSRQS